MCVSILTHCGLLAWYGNINLGQQQAIIWTNARILLIAPLGANFCEFFYQNSYIFIQENAFEKLIYKIAAILFQPQCVTPDAVKNMLSFPAKSPQSCYY